MGKVLTTQRLLLRPLHISDSKRITLLVNDFEVSKMLSIVPYPYKLCDAENWLASLPDNPQISDTSFAIDEDDHLIGIIGFHEINNVPEFGYWLGRSYWGKGYMSEATRAALLWLFTASPTEHVIAGAFCDNVASLHIQEKLGFEITGQDTRHCLANGQDRAHIKTQLTKKRFFEVLS